MSGVAIKVEGLGKEYIIGHQKSGDLGNAFISNIPPHLFWDTDTTQVDSVIHKRFIAQRILSRGSMFDFKLMNTHYSTKSLIAEIKQIRDLDKKSANLAAFYYSIPKDKMRCYKEMPFQKK